MTTVPAPNVPTRYADISAQGGQFGTIDYGDGSAAPVLFLGRQFDPREMQLDSGMPLEMPEAQATAVECPNCGGNLPLVSQRSERIVCQYCGTASDVSQGALSMLGPSPRPPVSPYIPLGAEGQMRGHKLIVCGFVIRSTMVEGVVYSWREYLLFGGDAAGYRWLMEEDGKWTFIEPLETGDIVDSGHSAMFRGGHYSLKQEVQAKVDYVIGEFYWKVEIGETVDATEFQGPGGKVSRERTSSEVNYSFVTPTVPHEISAFGVAPPMAAGFGAGMRSTGSSSEGGAMSIMTTIAVIIVICLFIAVSAGGGCGGTSGGYSGGGWSK
jgi:ribosomal protein S27E